jgi:hypothetical protein
MSAGVSGEVAGFEGLNKRIPGGYGRVDRSRLNVLAFSTYP